mmetsp:Transcript_23960/g.43736  ORF Transcript_23960/g.43736 Transcript_23960/m.43736 type:complete len:526 (-) Transcript_23960:708-2285(-)
MADSVGDGGVDGVFRDIATHAHIVVCAGFLRKTATLFLHLISGLPGAYEDFAHPAHGLTVRCDDRKGAHVVQDIFGGDGLATDTAFGERHVLGDRFVEVVTDHEHIEMLFERVHRKGARWVGGRGQHMLLAADFDDIRRVPTARPFGVKGVDRAALHGLHRILDKPTFVQRIGVDHHLHIHGIGHGQTAIDGPRRCAPILVQFHGTGPRVHLLLQRGRQRRIALARKGEVHRERISRLQHPPNMPWPGCAGGCQRAVSRASAAAQHGGQARMQCILDLLRADEVDVAVKASRRQDAPLTRDGLCARADDDIDAGLGVGIARLANGRDAPVFQAHIGLVDARPVHDQRVGDDGVHSPFGPRGLRLAHPVANDFAAAKFDLFAIEQRVAASAAGCRSSCVFGGQVTLNLDKQFGVGQAHLVAHSGAKHGGIIGAGDGCGHGRPSLNGGYGLGKTQVSCGFIACARSVHKPILVNHWSCIWVVNIIQIQDIDVGSGLNLVIHRFFPRVFQIDRISGACLFCSHKQAQH